MKLSRFAILLFLAGVLAGCSSLTVPKYPTLIPTEYVPTAIALTVEAGRLSVVTHTPAAVPSVTSPVETTRTAASTTRTPAAEKTTLTGQPSATQLPTVPLPTAQLPTALSHTEVPIEATPTPRFTATVTPTLRFYRTLTATATPGISNAAILLYNPGPMSRLTSPIQFSASLQPGPSGRVVIELVGEDGRILYRKLIRYTTHDWVAVAENVAFSIAAVMEAARLQIKTEDDQGRIVALASVDILLLSMGEDDLNPPTDLLEPLIIREPVLNTLIMGGKVVVAGLVRTSGEQPLLVELVDAKGVVVGYRQAVVTPPADPWATQGYATFVADVPYSVDGPTWVRLEVSAFEDHLPGPTHLSSLEILLGP